MLLEYMGDVDDKLFKKFSHCKDFNSFVNEFDRPTNKEDKEKVVNHYAQMEDDYSEYKNKSFAIINVVDYLLYEYSKKWANHF